MKIDDGFFLDSFAVCGERTVDDGRGSDTPSRLGGLRTSSENRWDLGDPAKEEVGGEVAQVELLAVDDWVPTVLME